MIRCAITDLQTPLGKDWEMRAAAHIQMVWLTDCESTVGSLKRPVLNKLTDKRLGIELAAMRPSIWRRPGESIGDTAMDSLPDKDEATDIVYWVDTDVMIVDPMTKTMNPEKLMKALADNHWSLLQPLESLQKKRLKQQQRKAEKDRTHGEDRPEEQCEETRCASS